MTFKLILHDVVRQACQTRSTLLLHLRPKGALNRELLIRRSLPPVAGGGGRLELADMGLDRLDQVPIVAGSGQVEGLPVMFEGLAGPSAKGQDKAEVVVGLGEVGLEFRAC